jgi:hypothetical protein
MNLNYWGSINLTVQFDQQMPLIQTVCPFIFPLGHCASLGTDDTDEELRSERHISALSFTYFCN